MPLIRKWSSQLQAAFSTITVEFQCPFFNEFVQPFGALNEDFEAHALWDYYGNALVAHQRAKANLVMEDELSLVFDIRTARNLFQSKAAQHGVRPDRMVRYWPMIHQQRIRMGGKDQLPDEFEFKFWGV